MDETIKDTIDKILDHQQGVDFYFNSISFGNSTNII